MPEQTTKRTGGRAWAYVGAAIGGAVSIAANVAHSYVPPKDAPVGWTPHTGAVVGAVFWPLALFVVIEILARVPWPDGTRWWWIRFGGLVPVAVVAAVVSYRHLSGLLAFYGEDGLTVVIGPLAVDGLMVMATGALIATGRQRTAEPVEVVTPVTSPADEPVDPWTYATALPAVPVPDAPAVPPAAGTSTKPRTDRTRKPRTGTARKTRAGTRTDDELLAALADVPRDPDGTVPVRRAATHLGTGPDRARRLLRDAGLLRTKTAAEPDATPVNGISVPDLINAN